MHKRKKGNSTKYVIVGAVMVVAILVAAFAVLNIRQSSSAKLPPVSQYLKVMPTVSAGEYYNYNRTVKITSLDLNVTAIGGDASNILIIVRSQSEDEGPKTIDFLRQGETIDVEITLRGYVTNLIQKDGKPVFPVDVKIGCAEAEEEVIRLYIAPENIVGVPAQY